MCLLAVVSFAAAPDTSREKFTLADGTDVPIWDTDGNGLIWYASTLNTEDGYDKYDYVANNQTDSNIKPYITIAKGGPYTRSAGGINYSGYQLNSITIVDDNGSYSSKSEKIVLANLQNMMFNETKKFNMFAETFRKSKALEAVYFDTTTDLFILNLTFEACSKLTYVNLENTKLLEIGGSGVFSNCSSLTSLVLPNTLKTIGHYPFQGTGIVEITIPDSVDSVTGSCMFKLCSSLERVYGFDKLIENGVLTSIPSETFLNCYELEMPFENGVIPEGVTTIDSRAFEGCSSFSGAIILPTSCTTVSSQAFQASGLETVYLGPNVTTVGDNALRDMSNLKNVYVSSKITSIPGQTFRATSNVCFYYTGLSASDLIAITENQSGYNNTILACPVANQIHFDSWDPSARQEEQSYIIYGVNTCYAFYNNKHTLKKGNDCTAKDECKNCSIPLNGQESHTLVESIVYQSFTQNGVYLCDCIFNGCTAVDITEEDSRSVLNPIFNSGNGFSTKESVSDGIGGGYSVDLEALKEYNRVNKDAPITFGVMIVNPNYLVGKDSFIGENGIVSAENGALQVDMSETEYSNVSISITGFKNAQDVSLIIALYAYTQGGEVEYIQSQTTACADKSFTIGETTLYTVTFESVKNANSSLDNLDEFVIPTNKEQE